MVTDEYINALFEGARFGEAIDNCVKAKRALIAKTLNNQLQGYWTGHTAYHIAVDGGFLHDAKRGAEKKLTALGKVFLAEHGEGHE